MEGGDDAGVGGGFGARGVFGGDAVGFIGGFGDGAEGGGGEELFEEADPLEGEEGDLLI